MSTTLPSRLQVIAEGVEDENTGILLLKMGCELAQGYFIAPPMPAEDFVNWFTHWTPSASWVQCDPWRLLVSDLPAASAGLVHRQMSELIVRSIHNPEPCQRSISTAHECEFGQWYVNLGKERYGHLPAFCTMEDSHKIVHELSAEIIHYRDLGDMVTAHAKAQELSDRLPLFTSQVDAFIGEIDRA